jgi:hypothetical protein
MPAFAAGNLRFVAAHVALTRCDAAKQLGWAREGLAVTFAIRFE